MLTLRREGVLSELLYADDLVLMIETITKLRSDFWQWKEAFESEGLECWPWMLTLRREGVLSELLYADDLVLMIATITKLRSDFW